MDEKWKYVRFEDTELADLGNGFFGADLLKAEGIELTFIKGREGSGHGFHKHEDLNEILIFLDGECVFTLDQTEVEVKGGSILYIPHEVDHKVRYKKKSSVLRLKIP